MKETVIYIIFAVLAVTLASFASYSPTDKWGRTALGIILLSSLVPPVFATVSEFCEISAEIPSHGSESYADTVGAVAEQSFCEGVRALVCERFGFSESEVIAEALNFRFFDMSADKIYITLYERAALADSRSVCEYVSERIGVECEVNISFE